MLNENFKHSILKATGATEVYKKEVIQNLWSGYGQILRLATNSRDIQSIVVKYVRLPKGTSHPRGWNTDISHERKIKSYQIEKYFYEHYSNHCHQHSFSRLPKCYGIEVYGEEVLMIFEDLDYSGYPLRKDSLTFSKAKICLSWLAHFHATFMGKNPEGLWKIGTYWHLDTRPDELEALEDLSLKKSAPLIDQKLNNCHYKTFVHGDAKLANFCFSSDEKSVSAVDFQYVGGGCGMKDVAYFIGSCLDESECERLEDDILNYYFSELSRGLHRLNKKIDFIKLEKEWRDLYPYAWADFHRFLKGWSPEHWKINSYSERIVRQAINDLS